MTTSPPGATCQFDVPWTVLAGNGDPVVNTVTVHYHPVGFPNDITDSDNHSLNLFEPSITFDKTADTQLSKAGDKVNYKLTLNNTSSPDSPKLDCTITDAKLGVNKQVTLASGASDVTDIAYTVQAGDPDPLVNNASVSCSPQGFPNVLPASDSWTVELFQPRVAIEKTGDTLSKVGDKVTYHFTVTNNSSTDSPNLILDTISDDVLGDLAAAAPAACDNLASGASCEFDYEWTVEAGKGDPVINTVTVHYHPLNFTNDITANDNHSLNLFQPSILFDKSADTELSKVSDRVNYRLALTNTSSPDTPAMTCTITDAKLGVSKTVTLASGASDVTNIPYTVQAGDSDPLVNTAAVRCTFADFPNILTDDDSWTVNLFQPGVEIDKTGDALSKVGDDVKYHFTITNKSSSDSPNLVLDTINDDVLGDLAAAAPAACDNLAFGASCEFDVNWTVLAGKGDPVVNTVTVHYHPAGFTNDITDSDNHSLNLFQPSIKLTKTGPAFSKEGDTARFTVTIENTSSADSPNLKLDSFSDSVVASVTPPASCNDLATGASCSFFYDYVVKGSDPDPLANTATAHYHPEGFPNDVNNSSTWRTDLLHPQFNVDKACKAQPISQAGPAVFKITFNNTGDADLHIVPSQGAAFDVVAGGSFSYDFAAPGRSMRPRTTRLPER